MRPRGRAYAGREHRGGAEGSERGLWCARERGAARLRGGPARSNASRCPHAARREPAGWADAAARGDGTRGARRARSRASRRRPDARRLGAGASPAARARGGRGRARGRCGGRRRWHQRAMNRTLGTAALGVSLCLLAGAFGLSSLYVPGIALILLVGAAAGSVRLGAWRVRLTRYPDRARVEEGAPLRLTLHLGGRTLPFGAGEVSSYPGAPLRLLRREAGPIAFVVRLPRRGAHRIEPSWARFRDPFGMCERMVCSPATDVLVLPRPDAIRGEQLARLVGAARELPAISGGAHGSDVDGLRAHRPGAPASLIHWPTVARSGELFERHLRAEGERLPLLVLDSYRPASEVALDAAVR